MLACLHVCPRREHCTCSSVSQREISHANSTTPPVCIVRGLEGVFLPWQELVTEIKSGDAGCRHACVDLSRDGAHLSGRATGLHAGTGIETDGATSGGTVTTPLRYATPKATEVFGLWSLPPAAA